MIITTYIATHNIVQLLPKSYVQRVQVSIIMLYLGKPPFQTEIYKQQYMQSGVFKTVTH